jgi:beta-lactamase superfamily II metal-dependent hydrolase
MTTVIKGRTNWNFMIFDVGQRHSVLPVVSTNSQDISPVFDFEGQVKNQDTLLAWLKKESLLLAAFDL